MVEEVPNTIDLVFGRPTGTYKDSMQYVLKDNYVCPTKILLNSLWSVWTECTFSPLSLSCVSRLTSLIFLGEKFMNDAEWQRVSVAYAVDASKAANVLREWDPLLRPVVHWFLPECRQIRRQIAAARRLIEPEVSRRLGDMLHHGGTKKVLDSIEWFAMSANGREFNYVNGEFTLAMASIRTTSAHLVSAIAILAQRPKYTQLLRNEIVSMYVCCLLTHSGGVLLCLFVSFGGLAILTYEKFQASFCA